MSCAHGLLGTRNVQFVIKIRVSVVPKVPPQIEEIKKHRRCFYAMRVHSPEDTRRDGEARCTSDGGDMHTCRNSTRNISKHTTNSDKGHKLSQKGPALPEGDASLFTHTQCVVYVHVPSFQKGVPHYRPSVEGSFPSRRQVPSPSFATAPCPDQQFFAKSNNDEFDDFPRFSCTDLKMSF